MPDSSQPSDFPLPAVGLPLLSRIQAFTQVERSLFVAGIFVGASLLFLAMELVLVRAAPPYLDRTFVDTAIAVQAVAIAIWVSMVLLGLLLRRRHAVHRPYTYATLAFSVGEIVYGTHFFGWYTSLFAGVTYMGASVIAFMLFDRWPALIAVSSALVIWVLLTAAHLLGLVSYAPLLSGAPFVDGQLHPTWIFGLGGASFALLLVFTVVLHDLVVRLRDRELRLARAMTVISRYVPGQLADAILAGRAPSVDRHDRRRLTIVFCDIVGFTALADRMEPEDLSRVLNEYLSELALIGEQHGGTIDKFVGDAIMVFFGAPTATGDTDQALRAIRMAMAMQERMESLRAKWLREGVEQPIEIRIGINTGQATVGNFGSQTRVDYTAIGRQVNLAARLQVHSPPGGILISHATYVLVQDETQCAPQGELEVRGFDHPVRVYLVTVS